MINISDENKLAFWLDHDDARLVLDQHAVFDIHSARSLKQQSADK